MFLSIYVILLHCGINGHCSGQHASMKNNSGITVRGEMLEGRIHPLAHDIHWTGQMYFQSLKYIIKIWIRVFPTHYLIESPVWLSENTGI